MPDYDYVKLKYINNKKEWTGRCSNPASPIALRPFFLFDYFVWNVSFTFESLSRGNSVCRIQEPFGNLTPRAQSAKKGGIGCPFLLSIIWRLEIEPTTFHSQGGHSTTRPLEQNNWHWFFFLYSKLLTLAKGQSDNKCLLVSVCKFCLYTKCILFCGTGASSTLMEVALREMTRGYIISMGRLLTIWTPETHGHDCLSFLFFGLSSFILSSWYLCEYETARVHQTRWCHNLTLSHIHHLPIVSVRCWFSFSLPTCAKLRR